MTEITLTDLRIIFGTALGLTVFGILMTTGEGPQSLITTMGGIIAFLVALFLVGLLFLYLQRRSAW
ncbi:hypothetical protein ZOD2009_01370 [Haladaptatus paucihalophilus DX253]|uniref:Uncharacterized protein n=1 Tax=Haladaptatus paucihalophilus DX253 TaxID=797209 RepID=E7QMV6_HALPU|nr:hypothetical protein [Haladaptatus paucihalophilus]EFW93751.1 hypothetical protein ZOD2009_01370 [Haladaptatus paucihalophilus DX253]SHL49888.1 hypothetical protein SAMN05444342_3973 [Haladaptatus paucihalophilus DX253]